MAAGVVTLWNHHIILISAHHTLLYVYMYIICAQNQNETFRHTYLIVRRYISNVIMQSLRTPLWCILIRELVPPSVQNVKWWQYQLFSDC